ncbi:MAG: hypothetical protein QW228_01135 [Candidatus Aenigmatarchaeota archaeon]
MSDTTKWLIIAVILFLSAIAFKFVRVIMVIAGCAITAYVVLRWIKRKSSPK